MLKEYNIKINITNRNKKYLENNLIRKSEKILVRKGLEFQPD